MTPDHMSISAKGNRADERGRQRTIQVHPTLTCNLRCRHCYSSSAPTESASLSVDTLCAVLTDAAALGYRRVAFSGGEPLVYHGLTEVLAHAQACGLRTTLTTNGMLLTEKRMAALRPHLDLIAVSLDGPPQVHNNVRQSPDAFDRLVRGVAAVRDAGIPFGFIHTVTRRSWPHLLWTAEFAAQQGARLLQLHPLELTGRAATLMRGDEPDDDLLARVYVLSVALASKYQGEMKIHFDAFRKDDVMANPEHVYASREGDETVGASLADLLGVMVVETDGTVVPVSYGFSHRYQVCDLRHQRLATAADAYVAHGYPAFRRLCRAVYEEIAVPCDLPFFDWHALIVARSYADAAVQGAITG